MATTTTTLTGSGKVRRSISCYNIGAACGIDEFGVDENALDHKLEERRKMHEELKARKEILNTRLAEKLAELKGICLQEAEITGVLPSETPRNPNEPLPVIRRRVRTEFSLSDKLLAEKTTEEEKRLADLELQLEIQRKIVEATKKLMNESNIKQKKQVKKQRKANYESAVMKLQKLESDLVRIKKQLADEQRIQLEAKYRIKKQVIEQHLSPTHVISSQQKASKNGTLHSEQTDSQVTITSSRLSRKRRGKIVSSSSENDFQSMPSSPIISRDFKISTVTPVAADPLPVPASPKTTAPITAPVSILKKSRPAPEQVVPETPVQPQNDLPRTSSLDNIRRKSYISAVSSHQTTPAYRGEVSSHPHFLAEQAKALPKNPPPPIPNSMAKRPLPPTPSQVLSSVSEAFVPEVIADVVDSMLPIPVPNVHRMRNNSQQSCRSDCIDISEKAVRSSVIRTPAITISTTSSSDAQFAQNVASSQSDVIRSTPSPLTVAGPTATHMRSRAFSGPAASTPPPESPDPLTCPSPTPSSASIMLYRQLQQQQKLSEERSSSRDDKNEMPPPTSLPPRKPKSTLAAKSIPSPLPFIAVQPPTRSYTPDLRSITPVIENDVFADNESLPPASPFISKTHTYVETPRPEPVPMSPSINPQTGVVVEVGTCRPSYEETKPFEFSDALKYSAKHRKRLEQEANNKNDIPSKENVSTDKVSLKGSTTSASNLMNDSFMVKAAVSEDFCNEMTDWYDENLKGGTVV